MLGKKHGTFKDTALKGRADDEGHPVEIFESPQ